MKSVVVFLGIFLSIWQAEATENGPTPQFEISGKGLATLTSGRTSDHQEEAGLDFSDSALVMGASQRLYDEALGSFVFGQVSTEKATQGNSTENSLFTHQAYLNYQSQSYEILLGRSRDSAHSGIDWPSLREKNLNSLLQTSDPFANNTDEDEQLYTNTAELTFNQNFSYYEKVYVQHRLDNSGLSSDEGINSAGIIFSYMGAPGLENFERFPFWSFGYEHIKLNNQSPDGLHRITLAGVLNVKKSVTDLVDLRFQNLLSLGSEIKTLSSLTDSNQADSNSAALSLRYLHEPFGGRGYQVALTGAYKNYLKATRATSWGAILSAARHLGSGFDLIGQWTGQWRSQDLAAVQSHDVEFENLFELGLSFSFDAIFNEHLTLRRSLLNQQHQYIPN